MGVSIRAYARSRGVSHVAVLKAAKAGRIPLETDGSVDQAKADAAWDRSTDPGKAKGTGKSTSKPAKPASEAMKPVAEAAVGSVRETLKEQGLSHRPDALHARRNGCRLTCCPQWRERDYPLCGNGPAGRRCRR